MTERKMVVFLIAATCVFLVGTIVTMVVPFKSINDPKLKIATVKPYTPLQLEGRDIYIREGCNNCHTQTVRPLLADTERYGEYSKTGEFVYDQPFLWGSRRTGPDLARIGGKYPDAWHEKHMKDPQSMVPRSNMPKYAFLTHPLDTSLTEKKMKTLGFPYTQADLAACQGKTELDAMVAYLQKLGTDIPWREAAKTQLVGELKNPFLDNVTVLPEGKKIYDANCAQCHGADLKGGVGPSLVDIDKPDADIFTTVYAGRQATGMPAFGDTLGKERTWKVVTFLKLRQRH
ncbi:cytochrome-c oxidase, cbb3-type subunit II [Geomesophilobacter sediminis]|uniref:Cytochrome-c oxidase, cbb3-type subunit II n=1 Tax=Geomesophilobacter sediminis TaxID=2798584 RepID=A0A8J7JI25_9BACT|nr:cytochrome-c oxidase, cbb3-type subunit II [Geomesophilobacter sediminis]MBJ6724110.1 cytochrome-c oxidase, cbb3-type subunit II [Geomesophilobacter sediminis]